MSETRQPAKTGRLLIVVDDAAMRRSAGRFLGRAGFEVVGVESGDAALDRLHLGERFDVAVLDLQMPNMNGLQLLEHIARDYSLLPAGLWSASLRLNDLEPVHRHRASFVVPKMRPIGELVAAALRAASGEPRGGVRQPVIHHRSRAWGLATGVRRTATADDVDTASIDLSQSA